MCASRSMIPRGANACESANYLRPEIISFYGQYRINCDWRQMNKRQLSNNAGPICRRSRHVGPEARGRSVRFQKRTALPRRESPFVHSSNCELRYLSPRVERRRRGGLEENKRRWRIERTITMSGGREVRAASGKAPGLPT